MNVTIARALKEKNRIAGRLRQAVDLVKRENRKIAGSPRSIDVAAQLAEAERLSDILVKTKTSIAEANVGIVGAIVELEEVKSMIASLSAVSTDDEVEIESRSYGQTPVERRFDVVLKAPDILEKVAALQKRADALQDRLDEFNAGTRISIPDWT